MTRWPDQGHGQSGGGTPDDPYQINTASDLAAIVNGMSASYVLNGDVTIPKGKVDPGEMLAETERFSLRGSVAVADVDLQALVEDRMRQGSWGQNARVHGRELRRVASGA